MPARGDGKGDDKGNRDDIARALGRASADYVLRCLELLRRGTTGNLLDGVICLAVVRGNLSHFLGDEAFDRAFSSIEAAPPDEMRRPVTIRGLSEFLDLPYETVRRNVARLTKQGLLEKHAQGYIVPVDVARREVWDEILRANVANAERLVRTYRRLTEEPAA
jgi:ribosomal protein L13E